MRFEHEIAALTTLIDKRNNRAVLQAPVQLFAMDDVGNAWVVEKNAPCTMC